jgi:hypothetical protein
MQKLLVAELVMQTPLLLHILLHITYLDFALHHDIQTGAEVNPASY